MDILLKEAQKVCGNVMGMSRNSRKKDTLRKPKQSRIIAGEPERETAETTAELESVTKSRNRYRNRK